MSVSFSLSLNVTFLFSHVLGHLTRHSFSRQNFCNILSNSSGLHNALHKHNVIHQCVHPRTSHLFYTMHAHYVFQVIIRAFFVFQTHATLWRSKPTYQPQHILLRNKHNCHYSITHPCYFHHLVAWLFLLHKTHTTHFISNSAFPTHSPLSILNIL